jgi:hypothetical protein
MAFLIVVIENHPKGRLLRFLNALIGYGFRADQPRLLEFNRPRRFYRPRLA